MPMELTSNPNPGHQSLGEHPWFATLCMCCHTLLMGELSINCIRRDFHGVSDGKVSAYNVGDLGSIPESGRPLEKEMVTHSSTLAWKIPWMEEPWEYLENISKVHGGRKELDIRRRHLEACS